MKIYYDEKMSEYNHRRIHQNCPECKNMHLLNDTQHGEIYCPECGLIIIEKNKFIKITEEIRKCEEKDKHIKNLWRRRIDSVLQD